MLRAIAWFAKNPVAANLLMSIFVVSGLGALFTLHQEEFPSMDVKVITVSMAYLGAAPEEVEEGVCVRIEEALEGTEGIEKLLTFAREGACTVQSMLFDNANQTEVLNEIKSKVDSINTFPVETEKPVVSRMTITSDVLQVAVHGETDERTLKEIGKEIRDEIATLDGVSTVEQEYVRPYEISIEVSEEALRRYGITLEQVSLAINSSSLDMPGGTIKTSNGEILLRAKGQAYWGKDFEDIVVLTRNDGTKVYLNQIANTRDTFEEGDLRARFNGQPASIVKVWRVGKEDAVSMAADVKDFIEIYEKTLPEGLNVSIWNDQSDQLTDRLSALNGMALSGLGLVIIILTLFLKFRVAMWVAAGIPIALLGTFAVFPYADISMSSMTVLAVILVLGVIVDDAIVVGERVYAHEQMGKPPVQAAIDGTWEISIPVIFGVLTTMAAFLPLIMLTGRMAGFFGVVGWVVIIALILSIIESQLILPSHLAHRRQTQPKNRLTVKWSNFQEQIASGLQRFAIDKYRPFLKKAIDHRYVTGAIGLGVLIMALALIFSGRLIFTFFPAIEGNRIYATLEMPEGISVEETTKAAMIIADAGQALSLQLDKELGLNGVVENQFSSIGAMADRENGPSWGTGPGRSHFAEVVLELAPIKERGDISAKVVANRWRDLTGDIPDAVELSFSADSWSAGEAVNYELTARDPDKIRAAATDLRAELSRYNGVYDISDSYRSGKQEIKLTLLPEARTLGLTLADLATQVRSAFYGIQVQRIQRGKDDVRIMVRFPESERRSIGNLEDMYIRTPQGVEVPFYSVANFEIGRGYSTIRRVDGRRVINVTAEVDRSAVSPEEIGLSVTAEVLPKLRLKYPTVKIGLSGEQEERTKAFNGLYTGALLSLLVIYSLLAIPLRSYMQPLVIMSVIPFGAVGAIVGHWILGYQLMFFSALGIVALSGVVVNASLVLVDYINRRRREGMDLDEAVLSAGVVRFRPILLTSITTFVGLIPLMSNATPATRFFIPMGISLAFGVLFATFITLILVPALYKVVEDISGWDAVAQGVEEVSREEIPSPNTAG